MAAIDSNYQNQIDTDSLRDRRRRGREAQILMGIERRYGSFGLEQLGGRRALLDRIRDDDSPSAFTLLTELGREIENALYKPQ